jgi:N,N-dimethylformamidase
MTVTGYTDRLSVAPGDHLEIMASVEARTFDLDILRLGRDDALVEAVGRGIPGRVQVARLGSFARIPVRGGVRLRAFTVAVLVHPTAPGRGRAQAAVAWWRSATGAGFALGLDGHGRPLLRLGLETGVVDLSAGPPLDGRQWHLVAGAYDGDGNAWIGGRPMGGDAVVATHRAEGGLRAADAPILLAALEEHDDGTARADWLYDGKLERPVLWGAPIAHGKVFAWDLAGPPPESEAVLARWSLGGDHTGTEIEDIGGRGWHGRLVGGPLRAVTGHSWSGDITDHRFAPSQYEAVHFHADDLETAGFDPVARWAVPANARSGLYVAELRAGDARERLPFVVRTRNPAPERALAILPTFTYLAYANERLGRDMATNRPSDWNPARDPRDAWLARHPELGRSLYDLHGDGSGVAHTSMLRPIPNMRDDYVTEFVAGPRHLAADRLLLAWLERRGIGYDVVCDHDLDRPGESALAGYRLAITGSHPEYMSARMLDALEQHLSTGGRIAYLGGNGFYWVAAVYRDRPHLLEVRRGNAGTRAWESAPGEAHLAATGEPGGLWRHRGRPPNALVGVGFCAQGWDGRAVAFRRLPASFRPEAAFVFAGVEDERIGAEGLAAGGAAGDEVDRADDALGTPAGALVLARSEPFTDAYQPVIEDQLETVPGLGGSANPDVRADMTLLTRPNGAAIFSVGSICWIASLPSRGWDGPTSRITENVVRAFLTGSDHIHGHTI